MLLLQQELLLQVQQCMPVHLPCMPEAQNGWIYPRTHQELFLNTASQGCTLTLLCGLLGQPVGVDSKPLEPLAVRQGFNQYLVQQMIHDALEERHGCFSCWPVAADMEQQQLLVVCAHNWRERLPATNAFVA